VILNQNFILCYNKQWKLWTFESLPTKLLLICIFVQENACRPHVDYLAFRG
jgi:hypothetical protein